MDSRLFEQVSKQSKRETNTLLLTVLDAIVETELVNGEVMGWDVDEWNQWRQQTTMTNCMDGLRQWSGGCAVERRAAVVNSGCLVLVGQRKEGYGKSDR